MKLEIPDHLTHLPRDHRGFPVPHVAAWSTERWAEVRHDPLVGNRPAIFTAGKPGTGRPILGALNEPRQRRSCVKRRCQVCDAPLGKGLGVVLAVSVEKIDVAGHTVAATPEPPCCIPCARWSIEHCPGMADFARPPTMWPLSQTVGTLQMIDPSRGPMRHPARYDEPPDPELMARASRLAEVHGGVVGLIKIVLVGFDAAQLEAIPARKPFVVSDVEPG